MESLITHFRIDNVVICQTIDTETDIVYFHEAGESYKEHALMISSQDAVISLPGINDIPAGRFMMRSSQEYPIRWIFEFENDPNEKIVFGKDLLEAEVELFKYFASMSCGNFFKLKKD